MTPFETWWAGLKNQPIPQLKPLFAECWNAAVEATDDALAGFIEDAASPGKIAARLENVCARVTP